MDFDNYDNYEMKERERLQDEQEQEQEREQEVEREQETNFDEFEDVVVHLEGLEAQERQAEVNMNLGGTSVAERDNIPNVRKDIARH